MKLFDVSQSVLDAVKTAMVESPACYGKAKGCSCKKCKPVTEEVKAPEVLDERNKENKFKKDLHVTKLGVEDQKKNLGVTPNELHSLNAQYGKDGSSARDNMKTLLKLYKKVGRAVTREEVEAVEEGKMKNDGSTYGVSTPLKTKGKHVSENGRHVAKVRKDSDWGEYRVELHSDGVHQKDADYHTDDKEEAHDTAKAMVAHAQKHEKPLVGEAVVVAAGNDESKRKEINLAKTKKTFPNVTHFTKAGHPDWKKHGMANEETEVVVTDTLVSKIINKYNK